MLVKVNLKSLKKELLFKCYESKSSSGYGNDTYIHIEIKRSDNWESFALLDVRYETDYNFAKFILNWLELNYSHLGKENVDVLIVIESNAGTMYVEKNAVLKECFNLLDSEGQRIAILKYSSFNVEKLADIEHISELVDCGIFENMTWSVNRDELIETIIDENNIDNDEIIDLLQANTYKVGDVYFIPNWTELI